ncbi:MAG: NrfD/PsrC family molybdoenzyme membrane anchor subunit [Polyangiales bacterium]
MSAFEPIEAIGERSLLPKGTTFNDVTETVARVTENKAPRGWWILFLGALGLLGTMGGAVTYLLAEGTGVWGNNSPVAWAWDITNFVWWIGIGHAGTLISAVLFLFRQHWRTAINRYAEAMTIFAVMCAGMFPALHTGRPWFDYYMFPLPNQMSMWPNFKSPLMWDVFAVSTYMTISILFWFVGLIPDLATLRDRSTSKIRRLVYGALASRLALLEPPLAELRARVPHPRGARRRSYSRCTASFRSTSRRRFCRAGTPRFSRRTSSRAPCSRVSRS